MELERKTIDMNKYALYDIYSDDRAVYEYRACNSNGDDSRKSRNRFFLKISKWSGYQHIGEFVASQIGKKIGFKMCDVDLYKARRESTRYIDDGIISYVEKGVYDDLELPTSMIRKYRESIKSIQKKYWVYDVDTIINAGFKKIMDAKRPYEEFLRYKQDVINMLVFDIKFANPDREDSNWMMRKNRMTGEIDLYPMFDNASILGFAMDEVPVDEHEKSYDDKLKRYDKEEGTSAIVTPASFQQGKEWEQYDVLLKFLLAKYPAQTKKALDAVNSFSYDDLKNLLDSFEELPEAKKRFTLNLFCVRDRRVNEIYREFLNKNQVKQIS